MKNPIQWRKCTRRSFCGRSTRIDSTTRFPLLHALQASALLQQLCSMHDCVWLTPSGVNIFVACSSGCVAVCSSLSFFFQACLLRSVSSVVCFWGYMGEGKGRHRHGMDDTHQELEHVSAMCVWTRTNVDAKENPRVKPLSEKPYPVQLDPQSIAQALLTHNYVCLHPSNNASPRK